MKETLERQTPQHSWPSRVTPGAAPAPQRRLISPELFQAGYIINLPSRADRRWQMTTMLAHVRMTLQPGRLDFFAAHRPDDARGFPSIGALGCVLSHLHLLRAAVSAGVERVLVMEDDLEIDRSFIGLEPRLAERLMRRDWGVVYFGHTAQGTLPASSDPLVFWDGEAIGTHFYGVAQPAMSKLVTYLEGLLTRPAGHPEGGALQYDGALNMFRQLSKVPTLWASPSLGFQRSSRSDVARVKLIDRLPLARHAIGALRMVKVGIQRRGLWRRPQINEHD